MQTFGPVPFRKILLLHAGLYPQMEPADAVKLAYQSAFGGGHLIASEQKSLAFLAEERAETLADATRRRPDGAFVPIGLGRARVNLASAALLPLPDALLSRMFVLSSREPAGDDALFEKLLGEARRTAASNGGAFAFSAAELDAYLARYRAAGRPMARHSETYRALYRPAYRVVNGAYEPLLPLLLQTQAALASGALPAAFPLGETQPLSEGALRLLAALFENVSFLSDAAAGALRLSPR